jgi:hypothetical protein
MKQFTHPLHVAYGPITIFQRGLYIRTLIKTNLYTRSNTQKYISKNIMHRIRQNYGRTHIGLGTKLVHGVHSCRS